MGTTTIIKKARLFNAMLWLGI